MTLASPPGVPDAYDISRLEGWQPLDLTALQERQFYLAQRYRTALLIWASTVAFCLCAMIFTGAITFYVVGYGVTVPFLIVCYKYRRAIDNAVEFQALCDLDDWC
jgi:hypothetical protein